MAKRTTVLFPKTIELLQEFGENLRLARLPSGGTGRNQPGYAVADRERLARRFARQLCAGAGFTRIGTRSAEGCGRR